MVRYPITLSEVTVNGAFLRQSASFTYISRPVPDDDPNAPDIEKIVTVFHDFSPKEVIELKLLSAPDRKKEKFKIFKAHIKQRINELDIQPSDTEVIGQKEKGNITI